MLPLPGSSAKSSGFGGDDVLSSDVANEASWSSRAVMTNDDDVGACPSLVAPLRDDVDGLLGGICAADLGAAGGGERPWKSLLGAMDASSYLINSEG
jgi:hypothetical protein